MCAVYTVLTASMHVSFLNVCVHACVRTQGLEGHCVGGHWEFVRDDVLK